MSTVNLPHLTVLLASCVGWIFVEGQLHVYGDGIMSAHGQDKDCLRSVRACEVPGVLFFSNRNQPNDPDLTTCRQQGPKRTGRKKLNPR